MEPNYTTAKSHVLYKSFCLHSSVGTKNFPETVEMRSTKSKEKSIYHQEKQKIILLKGLSYELDFENVDENLQILA